MFFERLFYAIIVVASIVMLFFLDTLYFMFGMVILLLKI